VKAEDLGALGVGTQIQDRGAADWAGEDQLADVVGPERGQDQASGAQSCQHVRVWTDDLGFRKTVEADDEHAATSGGGRGRDLAG
jgi:hypothetical protein